MGERTSVRQKLLQHISHGVIVTVKGQRKCNMNILHGISVIVLCVSLFDGVQGQASCALSWENGTALSDTIWSFGLTLDAIADTTSSGTIILSLTASSITSITTITPDSDSGYNFIQPVLDSEIFTLTLSEYFTQYEELETQTTIRTTIIFQCSTNTRTLEIALPITDTNNHYPEFQNAPYTYKLPMPFPSGFSVQLFGEISARDIDLTNTNISFTLNSSDPNAAGFTASWLSQDTTDTKLHYAQLLTTTLLSFDNNITFKIYATDNGSPTLTSETDITISVDEANSVPASPIFANAVYIADYSGLTIDEASGTLVSFNQGNVSLSQGADSTVVYTITDNIGSYADNFLVSVSEDYSYVSVTLRSVTEEFLAEPYALLTLTATRAEAANTGVTILHIDLPGSVCVNSTVDTTTTESSATECPTITTDACVCDTTTVTSSTVEDTATTSTDNGNQETTTSLTVTTAETTECPIVTVTQECDCGSTTVTEAGTTLSQGTETTTTLTPSLSFSSSVYRFDKDSSFTGVLMTQTAVATNAAGTIVYSVVIDNEDLASRVIIDADTAQLEVIATISPAIYTFQITATIEDLNLSTSASVVLVVSTLTNCSGEVVFGYALQVIELEEESAHENVLPLDDNGCNYTIYSQTPSQGLFSINGTSLNSVAVDREASYFSEMTVAQVRVIIDASCPNDTETVSTISKRDTTYEVLTENIAYQRTRTVLIVIITDINDNAPVWSSDTPSYIGFPGYDLSQVLQVPYVYKFSATDADIGANANVTYSLPTGSDDIFYIHNTEGSLYIQMGAYVEDGLELTIIASDGLFETSATLTVRKLESTNVMVLFVISGVLEDVDDIVQQLSTSTGYWIGSLGSAVVSASDISTSKSVKSVVRRATRSSDANTLLRVVLYGLVETEPVVSKVLVSTLDEANVTWVISDSATFESLLSEVTESDGIASSADTRGYWAAIIVLSLLLFLLLIAAGVVYYLFCRPRHSTSIESDITYENFEKSNVKEDNGRSFVNSITLSESRDDVTESTDWPSADWSTNQTNSQDIFSFDNIPNPPTGDEGDRVFNKRNENVGRISPNLTKRKSVAFNTTVEEIEVARL